MRWGRLTTEGEDMGTTHSTASRFLLARKSNISEVALCNMAFKIIWQYFQTILQFTIYTVT